jgi:hypothetical protein
MSKLVQKTKGNPCSLTGKNGICKPGLPGGGERVKIRAIVEQADAK